MTGTTTETVRETVIDVDLKKMMGRALDRRLVLDAAIDENIKATEFLTATGFDDAEAMVAALAMIYRGELAHVAKPLLDRLIALDLITVTVRL